MTITIYDTNGDAIHVTGHVSAGLPAPRDRYGLPICPDDEPEVEVTGAVNEWGTEVELTTDQEEEAHDALWEARDTVDDREPDERWETNIKPTNHKP